MPATGDIDPEAHRLAARIGGQPCQTVPSFGNREFDAVSADFIAQTTASAAAVSSPGNFLSQARREQIRATLAAAKQQNKTALFEFTAGAPYPDVVDFIGRNAERLEAAYQITEG